MYCIKCYICAGFIFALLTTSSVKSPQETFDDINIQSYQRSVLHVFWGSIFSISQHVLRLDYMRSDLSLSLITDQTETLPKILAKHQQGT